MKRIALWCLVLVLLSGCGQPGERAAETPEEEGLETASVSGEAMAAYAAITRDLTFAISVEAPGEAPLTLDVRPESAWNVEGRENLFPVSYEWSAASAADWEAQLAGDRGLLAAMTAPDGETALAGCTGGDVVRWTADGGAHYARAVNAREGQDPCEEKLCALLLGIAGDALRASAFSAPTVDGAETDLTAVAEKLAEQMAEHVRSAPDWVSWKPTDFRADGAEVFDAYFGQPENFCCGLGFRLLAEGDASNGPRSCWEAGSGLGEPDEDGWYGWGREALILRNERGDWYCEGLSTGGSSVRLPFGRKEDAGLEELLDAFFLTEGFSHDWLLPCCLLDRTDLDGLPALLDRRTEAEVRELGSILGEAFEEHADYFPNWTAETLRAALGPCGAYLDA